jgi:hypothetical protein
MKTDRSAHTTIQNWIGNLDGIAGIHSSVTFRTLIRHERARSSRDGSEFSFAVFDISSIDSRSGDTEQIVRVIREKMRSIDEVGWLDGRNIGVLLPLTNLQGGRRFAARVSESITLAEASIPWTVCAYPSPWLAGGNGDAAHDLLPTAETTSDQKLPSRKGPAHHGAGEAHLRSLLGRVFSLRVPAWKRGVDAAGSLVLIVLLSPLFLLVSIYIKIISPGRVLFRQQRVGYQGKLFTFLKFRTMHESNDPGSHREHLR